MKMLTAKQIRTRIWLIFAVFLGLCVWAALYFQQQSKQLLGSNFTALVVDVMQAQEDVHVLKRSLSYLKADSPFFDIQELEKAKIRIQYRIPIIDRKVRASVIDSRVYEPYLTKLSAVGAALPDMIKRIQRSNQDSENRSLLITQLTKIELDMAVSYSELHHIIQAASDIERRRKDQLLLLIWGLISAVFIVGSALLATLTRLYFHKEELTIQNNLDHLTQLPNRRYISEKAQAIIGWRPAQIGFAIIDLDLFKKINDLYGHPAGDEVLKHIADILNPHIVEPNLVARIGGEEFCVLFLNLNQQQVMTLCEEIRVAVEETKLKVNNSIMIHITLSIGLYYHEGERQTTFSQIYQYADQALYLAKKQGRNRLVLHDNAIVH